MLSSFLVKLDALMLSTGYLIIIIIIIIITVIMSTFLWHRMKAVVLMRKRYTFTCLANVATVSDATQRSAGRESFR